MLKVNDSVVYVGTAALFRGKRGVVKQVISAEEAYVQFADEPVGELRRLYQRNLQTPPQSAQGLVQGAGTPAHDGKLDSGKVDPGMLFHGCARALRAVLAVLEFGARKYAPDSWRRVPNAEVRYRAAFERHKQATDENGLWDIDPETGKYHVDHMITNLLFLRELKCADEAKGPK